MIKNVIKMHSKKLYLTLSNCKRETVQVGITKNMKYVARFDYSCCTKLLWSKRVLLHRIYNVEQEPQAPGCRGFL